MEQEFVNKEVKRIDRWVNYVVHHAWVKTGIFIVALLEATISPLLPEIIVAGVLTYRKDLSWKLLSFISALGSTTGVAILYVVGYYLYSAYQSTFDNFFDGAVIATYTEQILNQNTFVTMFLAAFTPLPDRIFALLSGVFHLQFLIVIFAFFFGRLIRVGIVAYFSYLFGEEAKQYILKHTKTVTILLGIAIVLYIVLRIQGIL
jgi:membrane protein YqaA with SNARE-associated domain